MKLSNFIILFLGIAACFIFVAFTNIDITQKTNVENTEFSTKLSSACYDAAQSMKTENVEHFGKVWHNEEDLLDTLTVFYNSLVYSFNWDNQGRVNEMALYTPVVCLVDLDGYYISHNVVFNTTGTVSIPDDAEKRNGLSALNTWTKSYNGVILRYFLNDNVEVYCGDGSKVEGNRYKVYELLSEKHPGEAAELSFIINDDEFNSRKNELIVREINKQCEYYINRHNVIGDSYYNQYQFEMPEVAGEDWSRLLQNPTVISFLQGYSARTSDNYLNVYSLAGGELVKNYHYFIDGDEYHCIEAESGVTKSINTVTTDYESEGTVKTVTTEYVVYEFNGHKIDTIYNSQTECAMRGATPHNCVYEWH